MADVAALSFWVSVLLGPTLWWLWEMVIIFSYFTIRFFRSWGKDIHLLLRYSEGGWHQIGKYLVPQTQRWFRTKSKKSFTAEPNMGIFDQTDLSGNHVTVLHDYDYARPRYLPLRPQKDTLNGKFPNTTKPKVGDPTSADFDTFIAGEVWKQGLNANKISRPDIGILIMIAVVGALAGFMLAYIGFPQKIPILYPVTTTVTT
jgi:hypothetical protein